MSAPVGAPEVPGLAPAPAVLELRQACRVHGSGATAVNALVAANLQVRPGELVAVMGPSGSGKSTLLNLAGALDRATDGQVLIEGEDVAALSPDALAVLRRRRIGFVFQDFNLIPSLTAGENVALPLELDGLRPSRARRAATDALVGGRRLVLADEPTGALDSHTGEAVLGVLRDRCDAGAAGLLVTHEARHAAWADRVIFLRDGRIVDTAGEPGSPDDLLAPIARPRRS